MVWYFSIKMSVQVNSHPATLGFLWSPYYILENHDSMPDIVLYIYYHTVFIFLFFLGFYHTQRNAVGGDGEDGSWDNSYWVAYTPPPHTHTVSLPSRALSKNLTTGIGTRTLCYFYCHIYQPPWAQPPVPANPLLEDKVGSPDLNVLWWLKKRNFFSMLSYRCMLLLSLHC